MEGMRECPFGSSFLSCYYVSVRPPVGRRSAFPFCLFAFRRERAGGVNRRKNERKRVSERVVVLRNVRHVRECSLLFAGEGVDVAEGAGAFFWTSIAFDLRTDRCNRQGRSLEIHPPRPLTRLCSA